jgi:hypothetical protein
MKNDGSFFTIEMDSFFTINVESIAKKTHVFLDFVEHNSEMVFFFARPI